MNPMDRTLIVQQMPALGGIPQHRLELLFTSTGMPRPHVHGISVSLTTSSDGATHMDLSSVDDPSTIYFGLPVEKAEKCATPKKLPYYPSYSQMSPEQRGVYLHWLRDVSQSIEIGYVFVYYYGLERHLIGGRFEAAVDEVLALRKHHQNPSLLSYSISALVHACILRRRIDVLRKIEMMPDFNYFGGSTLLVLHHRQEDLTIDTLLQVAGNIEGVNSRYLRNDKVLYREVLSDLLQERFGKTEYPFAGRFTLEQVGVSSDLVFANTSFPSEIREPSLPNFLQYAPLVNELQEFFAEVHEMVKSRKKREARKGSAEVGRDGKGRSDKAASTKGERKVPPSIPTEEFQALESAAESALLDFVASARIDDLNLDSSQAVFASVHLSDLTHAMIRSKVKLIRKQDLEENDPLGCHFFYMHCIRFYYPLRDRKVKAYEHAKFFCQQQVRLTSKSIHAFLVEFGPPLPAHTGFQQLSIIYQKEKNYNDVIQLCKTAMKQGWAGDWPERIKRAERQLAKSRL